MPTRWFQCGFDHGEDHLDEEGWDPSIRRPAMCRFDSTVSWSGVETGHNQYLAKVRGSTDALDRIAATPGFLAIDDMVAAQLRMTERRVRPRYDKPNRRIVLDRTRLTDPAAIRRVDAEIREG
jgi:hypothetical protein